MTNWKDDKELLRELMEKHPDLLAALQGVEGVIFYTPGEVRDGLDDIPGLLLEIEEAWEEAERVGF